MISFVLKYFKISTTFKHELFQLLLTQQNSTKPGSLLCCSLNYLPRPCRSPLTIIADNGHYLQLPSLNHPSPLLDPGPLLLFLCLNKTKPPDTILRLSLISSQAHKSTSFHFSKSLIQLISLLSKRKPHFKKVPTLQELREVYF